MDAAAVDPVVERHQHDLDQRHFEAWLAQATRVPTLEYVWHTALKVGRRTPNGGADPGSIASAQQFRPTQTARQQMWDLLETKDNEIQALNLILGVIEHWLPIEKLDGELPEVARANAIARARMAKYLAERFDS
jgi:hypothetical protein